MSVSKNNTLLFVISPLIGIEITASEIIPLQASECSISVLKGFEVSDKNIEKGLLNVAQNTDLKGRWEIINNSPKTILDVGHNINAFTINIKEIKKITYLKLRIVIAFVEGKDYKKILKLFPKNAFFYFCQLKINRALNVDTVFNYSKEIGLQGIKFLNANSAYVSCLNESQNEDLVFVCGSNFLISEIINDK